MPLPLPCRPFTHRTLKSSQPSHLLQVLYGSDGSSEVITIRVGRMCFAINSVEEDRVLLEVIGGSGEVVFEVWTDDWGWVGRRAGIIDVCGGERARDGVSR